jgi:hypothetical protein
MKKGISDARLNFCQFMSSVPVIAIEDTEFHLSKFLRLNWSLFLIIAIFSVLSGYLTLSFSPYAVHPGVVAFLGIDFNMQEISIATCILIAFLGSLAVLWEAFAAPRDKPIFYYFIGMESFKRLLLIVPLFMLVIALAIWTSAIFPHVVIIIFSIVGFCLGIVIFSSLLVLISRAARIRRIILTTMAYALLVFFISLGILLSVNFRAIDESFIPVALFVYAMGTAAVFYIIATLIFEMILPWLYRWT